MIFLILILVAATFLSITNPNKDDFLDWGVEQLQSDSQTDLEKIWEDVVGEQVLKAKTVRQNYVVFSIYEVDSKESVVRYLGIVDHFFKLSNKK